MRFTKAHVILLAALPGLPLTALAAPCPASEMKCSQGSLLDLVPRVDLAFSAIPDLVSRGLGLEKRRFRPKPSAPKPAAPKPAPPAPAPPKPEPPKPQPPKPEPPKPQPPKSEPPKPQPPKPKPSPPKPNPTNRVKPSKPANSPKSKPAKSTPAKSTPAKSTPAKSTIAKSTPAKSTASQTASKPTGKTTQSASKSTGSDASQATTSKASATSNAQSDSATPDVTSASEKASKSETPSESSNADEPSSAKETAANTATDEPAASVTDEPSSAKDAESSTAKETSEPATDKADATATDDSEATATDDSNSTAAETAKATATDESEATVTSKLNNSATDKSNAKVTDDLEATITDKPEATATDESVSTAPTSDSVSDASSDDTSRTNASDEATSTVSSAPSAASASSSSEFAPLCKRGDDDCTFKDDEFLEKYRVKGEKSQNDFKNALGKDGDNKELSKADNYEFIDKPVNPFEEESSWYDELLPASSTEESSGWVMYEVKNKAEHLDGKDSQLILKAFYNPEQGVILIEESFNRDRDVLTNKQDLVMRWSDMVTESWARSCKLQNQKTDGLQYVIRRYIDDDPNTAKDTITVFQKLAGLSEDPEEEKKGMTVTNEGKDKPKFQAILGTPHGDRINRMLGDNHKLFGADEKAITKFDPIFGGGGGGLWNMVIKIEPMKSPE